MHRTELVAAEIEHIEHVRENIWKVEHIALNLHLDFCNGFQQNQTEELISANRSYVDELMHSGI